MTGKSWSESVVGVEGVCCVGRGGGGGGGGMESFISK